MVRKLIEWALSSPLIVLLLALALGGFGAFAFWNINVWDPLESTCRHASLSIL